MTVAPRLTWLDLARGVAVLAMILAYTSPAAGLQYAMELLAAPLFAMLLGGSSILAWERRTLMTNPWIISQVLRGLLLIGIGFAVGPIYGQEIAVLQVLGIITIILGIIVPLISENGFVAFALAAVGLFTGALTMALAREILKTNDNAFVEWLFNVLAAGPHFRVTTLLVFAFVGILFVKGMRSTIISKNTLRDWLIVAIFLLVWTITIYVALSQTTWKPDPYAGNFISLLYQLLMTIGVGWVCVAIAFPLDKLDKRHWLTPLTALGKFALTSYVVMLVILRIAVSILNPADGSARHWSVTAACIVIVVALAWAWHATRLPRPIESIVRAPAAIMAQRSPGTQLPPGIIVPEEQPRRKPQQKPKPPSRGQRKKKKPQS